ncbi:ATP-binding cassette domain-containing protein [Streptomyces europaeiscabiei]|uniref:ATP-binding cassette domain-containing protein n=2 Tax=Streptomyces europaeiscabiei TaxID=146819 RepID=UPI002E178528
MEKIMPRTDDLAEDRTPGTTDGERSVPAVTLTGVTKSFPGVRALSDVDFDCRPGEVHALVGENGSGKSTLIKIASGVLGADEGTVLIGGEELGAGGVQRARRLGLITAYQDTSLVPELSVADNITLSFNAVGESRPPDLDQMLARFNLPFRPTDLVSALGPGARQLLEVARAMAHRPRVLMLDEPTAALDMRLAEQLSDLIKQARDEGTAIVYVSHRLAEVKRLADRVTVLRDGVIQGTHASRDWNVDEIVELMVGAPTELEFPTRTPPSSSPVRLDVQELSGHGFGPVSINVRAGEIVGVAGAEGNGQRALLRGIIGIDRTGGSSSVDDKKLRRVTPATALDAGISFQSGDRAAESVFESMSVMDNATIQLGPDAGPAGLSLSRRLLPAFRQAKRDLGIVAASPYQPVSGLSGGNQQKSVLARPALRQPKVLIVDEPTQGVDARARMDIYRVLASAADEGIAVLVNSSDSAELAGLCDRVYVMSRGRVVEELSAPTTETEIVRGFVSATDVAEEQGPALIQGQGLLRRLVGRVSAHLPIAILLLLITMVALYTGTQSDVFWTKTNLANLLILTLPLAFVAIGQQFVMFTGLLDISIGSTMSLTVVLVSMTLPDLGMSSVLSTLGLLTVEVLAIGLFNVLLIEVLKVTPIVATVATMGIVQGIAIVLRPQPEGAIAPELVTLVAQGIGFVPAAFIMLVVIAVATEFWLRRSRGGLALRAVGFHGESARRVGTRVVRVRVLSLILCALGAVIGGVFLASQTGLGSNAVGAGYTLPCFAAVFLGGAVLSGGRGSFIGAMLGALFLGLLNNVTPLLHIPDAWQQILYGGILLVAVGAYASLERARNRGIRTA